MGVLDYVYFQSLSHMMVMLMDCASIRIVGEYSRSFGEDADPWCKEGHPWSEPSRASLEHSARMWTPGKEEAHPWRNILECSRGMIIPGLITVAVVAVMQRQ